MNSVFFFFSSHWQGSQLLINWTHVNCWQKTFLFLYNLHLAGQFPHTKASYLKLHKQTNAKAILNHIASWCSKSPETKFCKDFRQHSYKIYIFQIEDSEHKS